VAQLEINLKSVILIIGIVSALVGNTFIVGQLFKDFKLMKEDILMIQESQNVLLLKQEVLELNYKLKSLRMEVEGFGDNS